MRQPPLFVPTASPLHGGGALWAVPLPFRCFCQPDTSIMEPLDRALEGKVAENWFLIPLKVIGVLICPLDWILRDSWKQNFKSRNWFTDHWIQLVKFQRWGNGGTEKVRIFVNLEVHAISLHNPKEWTKSHSFSLNRRVNGSQLSRAGSEMGRKEGRYILQILFNIQPYSLLHKVE